MSNPWLGVPLGDYEGHMQSPEVQQLEALSDLFAEALAYRRPRSVAILGIASGNGLDRIDSNVTKRVVGVDVNPSYLETVRGRYPLIPGLELCCADLAKQRLDGESVQLVHAALVFEHAGVGRCLENALSLVAPGGALSVVLQLPSESARDVADSQFHSIQNLKAHFSSIDTKWLTEALEQRKLRLTHEVRRPVPAGKAFWLGIFVR